MIWLLYGTLGSAFVYLMLRATIAYLDRTAPPRVFKIQNTYAESMTLLLAGGVVLTLLPTESVWVCQTPDGLYLAPPPWPAGDLTA